MDTKPAYRRRGLLPALLATALVASACSSGSSSASPAASQAPASTAPEASAQGSTAAGEPVTLTLSVIGDEGEKTATDAVTAFEAANPGINVNIERVDWENYVEQTRLKFASGNSPDVFMLYSNDGAGFLGDGLIAPISKYVDQSTITPAAWDLGSIDNDLYWLPLGSNVKPIWWRKSAFNEVGLDPEAGPTTWDQLRDQAIKLTKRDDAGAIVRKGFGVNSDTDYQLTNQFIQFLRAAGGDYYNADGTAVAFNSDAGRRALQFLVDLVQKDKVVEPGNSQTDFNEFPAGTVGLTITGDWAIAKIEDVNDVGLAIPPGDNQTLEIGGDSLFLSSKSAHPDEAGKLLSFLINDYSLPYSKLKGRSIPATITGASDPSLTSDPIYQKLVEFSAKAKALPKQKSWAAVESAILPILQEVYLGRATVEDALSRAEQAANEAIASLQ